MRYKMVVSDLDETLLGSDRKVAARNAEAIKKARELGVKFVPATGRGYTSIRGTLEEIGLREKENEYVISFNGGAITENKGERLLHFQGISFEKAEELFSRGLSYDVCIHVYTIDKVYVYRLNQNEADYVKGRMEIQEFFTDNLNFLRGQEIVKVIYVNTDWNYLNRIANDLQDITGDLDVSYSSNRYMEFNQKGVNKGSGLLFLARLLKIRPEEVIAVGDNFNDLSMIRAAGLGVGVQNTVSDLKPLCDVITEADCDEGAIGEVIEKYVLAEL
mgnify:CR=1 FL=1